MSIKVFIENEAGKAVKNLHNEKTLEFRKEVPVMAAYPYPYGFILGTTSGDGDNLDCFVITKRQLKTRDIVEVEPIALMEQVEDDEFDHKIIAVFDGEATRLTEEVAENLAQFVKTVFSNLEGKRMEVGPFLGREEAIRLIEYCQDKSDK